jgi:hypothetical protein
MNEKISVDHERRTIIVVDASNGNKKLVKYHSTFIPTVYTEQMNINGKMYTIQAIEHKITTNPFFDVETIVYVEPGYYGSTRSENS